MANKIQYMKKQPTRSSQRGFMQYVSDGGTGDGGDEELCSFIVKFHKLNI